MKKKISTKIIPTIIGFIIVCFAVWVQIHPSPLLNKIITPLDRFIYDSRLRFTLKPTSELPPIAIIDIDEKSLSDEGHWPWPRDKIAKLLVNLKRYGVAVVAFDVIFPEPENNIAESLLQKISHKNYSSDFNQKLRSLTPEVDNNIIMANAMKQQNIILGLALHPYANKNKGVLSAPLNITNIPADFLQNNLIGKYSGYISNIAVLQNAAKNSGFINSRMDSDGVVRYAPLLLQYDNQLYPSLALAAVLQYFSINEISLKTKKIENKYVVDALKLNWLNIPTNDAAEVPIHFWGNARTFPYISATDVIQEKANPKNLFGAIVFIGTSAVGLHDLLVSPINPIFPGVEIQANIAASILSQTFHERVDWIYTIEFTSTIILGFILALALPWLNALVLLLFGIIAVIITLSIDYYFWIYTKVIFSSTIFLILIFLLVLINLIYGFAFEHRRRIYIKKIFGQYVPPEVVEEMSENPQKYSMSGESRTLTCLFSDIRNFTTIAEHLDATQVKELLNDIFTPITEVIFNTHGTIDKYVGDMVMAFWGAPIADKDHAKHALEASFLMLEKLKEVNINFAAKNLPKINIGIGLNTGKMNVGDMGSQFRKSYTVIGDAVNIGSRLQDLTKFYHANILVSEDTQKGQSHILWRKLDKVQVKGRRQSLDIYEPICYLENASPELIKELESYHHALNDYYQRKFDTAEKMFTDLQQQKSSEFIYQLYLDRIHLFKTNGVSQDWDGTYVHEHK